MDPRVTGPVEQLLRSVQQRLWIEALCERERRAAWVSAVAVLGGAAWHLGLRAHPGYWTAAAALVVLTLPVALAALSGWPAAAEAARRADAWFDGKELMTSAHDQLLRAPSERAGAADFVLARAAESAIVWRERLARRRLRLGLRRLSAPLAVALVGGFLHLLPGRAPSAALHAVPAGAARDGAADAPAAGPAGDVLAWSRPAPPATAPTADPETGAVAAPGSDGAEPSPTARGSGAGPGTGRLPGESAPREGVLDSASDEPLGTSFLDLPRPAGRDAAASRAIELGGDVPGGASKVPAAAPPAEATALAARADLPPVLRAYVAAYLRPSEDVR